MEGDARDAIRICAGVKVAFPPAEDPWYYAVAEEKASIDRRKPTRTADVGLVKVALTLTGWRAALVLVCVCVSSSWRIAAMFVEFSCMSGGGFVVPWIRTPSASAS